jgi:SMI1 / KNR4 family (SUKH-1)
MPSGETPRLRVVVGGGLSGGRASSGATRGARLRSVEHAPGREGSYGGDAGREGSSGGGAGREGSSGGAGRGAFDWRAELELVAPDVTLLPGCSRTALAAAEGSLGFALPRELIEFLSATDGVYDGDSHYWYAWSLERLVDESFDPERPADLLGVGDDAGSGWFCLPLDDRTGVVHYDRVTGARRTLARDLRGLWLGWFGGTLGV